MGGGLVPGLGFPRVPVPAGVPPPTLVVRFIMGGAAPKMGAGGRLPCCGGGPPIGRPPPLGTDPASPGGRVELLLLLVGLVLELLLVVLVAVGGKDPASPNAGCLKGRLGGSPAPPLHPAGRRGLGPLMPGSGMLPPLPVAPKVFERPRSDPEESFWGETISSSA